MSQQRWAITFATDERYATRVGESAARELAASAKRMTERAQGIALSEPLLSFHHNLDGGYWLAESAEVAP
jgi:hypothetical protein